MPLLNGPRTSRKVVDATSTRVLLEQVMIYAREVALSLTPLVKRSDPDAIYAIEGCRQINIDAATVLSKEGFNLAGLRRFRETGLELIRVLKEIRDKEIRRRDKTEGADIFTTIGWRKYRMWSLVLEKTIRGVRTRKREIFRSTETIDRNIGEVAELENPNYI